MLLLVACTQDPEPVEKATNCLVQTWYEDADGDGFGGLQVDACDAPAGHVGMPGDCDDSDPDIRPDATETCDGIDQDCDGDVDDGLDSFSAWPDTDGDGYGDEFGSETVCAVPEGWILTGEDCDDTDPAVNPTAAEVCNGYDDDCDARIDDADEVPDPPIWGEDVDGDGYGNPATVLTGCEGPDGYAPQLGDCDDNDSTIHPDATETCRDFVDQDCDGYSDDYLPGCIGDTGRLASVGCGVSPGDIDICAAGVAAFLPSGATSGSVQTAMDAASPGDVVSICPGTWTENLVQNVSPLALAGFGTGVTALDGAGGQIIKMGVGAALSIVDMDFQDGNAASSGGAIDAHDADLCIESAAFLANTGRSAGALYLGGTGRLVLSDVVFEGNTATGSSGGAVYAGAYETSITGGTFTGNTAHSGGGAIAIGGEASVIILGSTFTSNSTSTAAGGAIEYTGDDDGTELEVVDATFTENVADTSGGAIDLSAWDHVTATLVGCTFTGNVSDDDGGAVYLGGYGGGSVRAVASEFRDNESHYGGAFGFDGKEDAQVTFDRCTLDSNVGFDGAALSLDPSDDGAEVTALLIDSVVTRNTASDDRQCGAVYWDSETATIESIDTDWGAEESDNSPDDVCHYSWDGVASFVCAAGVCG